MTLLIVSIIFNVLGAMYAANNNRPKMLALNVFCMGISFILLGLSK